jgi:hypothetical protein
MTRFNFFIGIIITSLVLPLTVSAQRISISGNISDLKTGVKIKDVDVFEKISDTGTTSNEAGYFRLLLNPGKVELIVSEPGYETLKKDFELRTDTTVTWQLKPKRDFTEGLQAGRANDVEDSTSTMAHSSKQ